MLCPLHTPATTFGVECQYIFFCISKDAVCVHTEFSCWMVWGLWVRSCHKILQLLNNMVHDYSETDTASNRHDCHTISSWIALCKYGLNSNYFHSEKPQAIPFHDCYYNAMFMSILCSHNAVSLLSEQQTIRTYHKFSHTAGFVWYL